MSYEFKKTMEYLKSQLSDPVTYDKLEGYIKGLESERSWAQQEYCRVQDKLQATDCELENTKKTLQNTGDTLKLYEVENAALKEVVRSQAQLAAVILTNA